MRQAKLAASGDTSALEDLQKRIKSGYIYDDFTQIEGIGAKARDVLHKAKIRSFEDLAATSPDQLKKVLDKAGLSMNPNTWPKQAEFIVIGDLSGLKEYQKEN